MKRASLTVSLSVRQKNLFQKYGKKILLADFAHLNKNHIRPLNSSTQSIEREGGDRIGTFLQRSLDASLSGVNTPSLVNGIPE